MVENTSKETTPVETKSLTDWDNEPTVADLKQDFTLAKSSHSTQVNKINRWLDFLHITGVAKKAEEKNRSNVQPKLIRKQAEWRYASLSEPFLSTEDLYNIAPTTYEDREAAIENELILNYQFNNKLNKVNLVNRTVRAIVNEGTVMARVVWDLEEETVTETELEYDFVEDPSQEALTREQGIHQIMVQNPMEYESFQDRVKEGHQLFMQAGIPYTYQVVGEREVEKTVTIKNQPNVEVCDYNNLIIDPTCGGDIDKATFFIYSFETSLSELKKDGDKYTNLDQIQLESNSPLAQPDHEHQNNDESFRFSDEPRKKLVAYEYWGYWDINDDGIAEPIVATWVGETMIRMEENPYPDKKPPFVVAPYNPVKNSVYGEPDGELLEDNQKIIGAITRGMIDVMGRSANGQIGFRKDALDIVNKRKYEQGKDYEFNPQVNPDTAIIHHKYPEIPQSAEYIINLQNAEAESMSGVKAFHSGISGQALGDTATGIRSALDATSKRELDILRRLSDFFIKIGKKVISMNAEWLDDEEIIRVTNDKFINIKREALAGDFDLKLSISTAEADNQKAQELSFMLQTVGNSIDPGLTKILLADVARLRKMPDLAKQIVAFQPEPDPMQQQMQMLQLKTLEAELMHTMSKAAENDADRQHKLAQAQKIISEIRLISSQADNADLDFLEKESGIAHQRELQKMNFDRLAKIDVMAADAVIADEGRPDNA